MSGCRCGHGRAVHEHYRAGSDCAVCRCIMFQRRRWWRVVPGSLPRARDHNPR